MGANQILVIPNNTNDSLGFLLLYIAAVIVFFTFLGITLKKSRISKLKGYAQEMEQMKQLNDHRKEKAQKKGKKVH